MSKLTSFRVGNKVVPISFIETMKVKAGVECDVYAFTNDSTQDLAIVRVAKGYKTPLQRILKGDKTIEGFVDGQGTLTVHSVGGTSKTYSFSNGKDGVAIAVGVGEMMQWYADGDADLTFYEICKPPYEDGRFENLPEKKVETRPAVIASKIKQNTKQHKPVLIAIDGYGGSGKTTQANHLRDELGNAYVVNIDDFIVKEKLTEPSWDKGGFDRERLERQVLLPASKQEPIKYQELIWETNTLSEPKIVPQVDYLIVEGISSYHPNLAHYYDFKIWVDTPIEVAKARGKARDAGNENADKWDMWAENDLRYREKYHPEKVADFVISNS